MNLLDLLLSVIIGISVATGFMAGFARVGVGFIASISGLFFGFWYYNVPAVLLTNETSIEIDKPALLTDVFLLRKPVNVDELNALIGQVLARRSLQLSRPSTTKHHRVTQKSRATARSTMSERATHATKEHAAAHD